MVASTAQADCQQMWECYMRTMYGSLGWNIYNIIVHDMSIVKGPAIVLKTINGGDKQGTASGMCSSQVVTPDQGYCVLFNCHYVMQPHIVGRLVCAGSVSKPQAASQARKTPRHSVVQDHHGYSLVAGSR